MRIISVLFLFFCGISSVNSQVHLISTSTLSDMSYVIAANNIGRNPKYKDNKKNFPKWRHKKDKDKLKGEVDKYDAYLKGNKIITEGIIAHEGEGHTIRNHVGVSKNTLEKRIEYEKKSIAKKHDKKIDHKDLSMESFSSFKSLKEADRLIDSVLARNQHKLKTWMEVHKKKRKMVLTLNNFKHSTGLAVDPKTKKIVEAKGVKVILKKIDQNSPRGRGWIILTAYPVK